MDRKTRCDGKFVTNVLALVGLLTVIAVGVGLWATWDKGSKIVARTQSAVRKIRPAAKEVIEKSVDTAAQVLVKARSDYEKALEKFEVQKDVYVQELGEGKNTLLTFQEAMKKAQGIDVEFEKVYTKWAEIELEVERIQEKFVGLTLGADALYTELETRANSITSEHLRTITLKKIVESRKRYTLRLKQCKTGIDNLNDANQMVCNTMIALEVDYGLVVLEEVLDREFTELNKMIESVMAALEDLSQESKKLLEIRIDTMTEG